ncbi:MULTISPECIES: uridine kinase [unclassified Granulicatella]|uniref:uridine kinase n=1 Tax=unclassified Granulicatella TaxID=2630493 RepID=UPI001073034D|nr:uridine kinase [Granulicatella sp. WM01]MBF0779840.1 uridine kinase [Granulicatella sp. 19428wC4_WM01]TFU96140.1 uridine kinase [Granulicatella sp. WM01]
MVVKKPIVIGVTGGSGSGKTSVSRRIVEAFPGLSILLLEQDAYYKDQSHLTFEERVKTNYDHPLAFDGDLLVNDLKKLIAGQEIQKPVYDYVQHTRSAEVIKQLPKDVVILEGLFVLDDPKLRELMDIKIYVDTDDDIRIIRRIKRDMEERGRSLDSIITQYLTQVKPMYHQFIEPTKRLADIIIPEGGNNQVALDLIVTKIAKILDC